MTSTERADRPVRVLALCAFPVEAAATRFRLHQFVGPLRNYGVELSVRPFLSSRQFDELYRYGSFAAKAIRMLPPVFKRFRDTFLAGKYDALLVQREAMIVGPAFFEWLARTVSGAPMLLDLDDATYVRYVSPTYGRLGSFFKFFGKTDSLIRSSTLVICGNRYIAEYVESRGTPAVVIPTVVDLEEFRPQDDRPSAGPIVIGWIGTHSTFPFLESLFPVLERLSERHRFRLKVVGSGRPEVQVPGVEIENLGWSLERESDDFRSLDIGLYPITTSSSASEDWIKGKSGFKAVQYMAVGVPFVMSPIGVCGEIGEPGYTHFNANTLEDWYNSLDTLLADGELRIEMGLAARKYAIENYDLMSQAEKIAEALKSVGREHRSRK